MVYRDCGFRYISEQLCVNILWLSFLSYGYNKKLNNLLFCSILNSLFKLKAHSMVNPLIYCFMSDNFRVRTPLIKSLHILSHVPWNRLKVKGLRLYFFGKYILKWMNKEVNLLYWLYFSTGFTVKRIWISLKLTLN